MRPASPGTTAAATDCATGSASIARPSSTSAGSPSCRWAFAFPGRTPRGGRGGRRSPAAHPSLEGLLPLIVQIEAGFDTAEATLEPVQSFGLVRHVGVNEA